MPIYEYQCQKCGEVTEALQRMSDPPLTDCSKCDGDLKRLISAPAVQFKGSGWYVTDYAGKKGGESKGGESKGDGSKSSSGGDAGSKDSGSSSSSSDKSSGGKSSGGEKKSA